MFVMFNCAPDFAEVFLFFAEDFKARVALLAHETFKCQRELALGGDGQPVTKTDGDGVRPFALDDLQVPIVNVQGVPVRRNDRRYFLFTLLVRKGRPVRPGTRIEEVRLWEGV